LPTSRPSSSLIRRRNSASFENEGESPFVGLLQVEAA
jgi:hypothetical protein